MRKLSFTVVSVAILSQPALAEEKKWYEEMQVGPAWMNTFGDYFHGEKRVGAVKGVSLDLGDGWRALFDTETLRLGAVYNGGLEWGGTPWTGVHGALMTMANKDGSLVNTATVPGWANAEGSFEDTRENPGYGNIEHGNFLGHYRNGNSIVLEYDVHGTKVLDTLDSSGETITRTMSFGPRGEDLVMLLADEQSAFTINEDVAKSEGGLAVAVTGGLKLVADPENPNRLLAQVPKGGEELTVQIAMGMGDNPTPAAAPDFKVLTSGGPGLWTEILTTEGKVSTEIDKPYVTDQVGLPTENPWKSNLRFGGFDFIDEDSAALSTWNGDVWVVKGLSGDWKELKWQRIAAGLFETLGVKVVDGIIHVNGRDQITQLIDLNDDGETDHFKVFNRDVIISSNFHEFAFDLHTDDEGNFYFAKASPVRGGGRGFDKILPHHGIVAKISPDGEKFEVIATGLRAPGGMGVGPNGEITTGENEGTWQPVCRLNYARPEQLPLFFGTEDARHSLTSAPHTEPLAYLPMDVDNSGGSQTWVPEHAKFGLNTNDLLHLSYGQSSIYRVLPVERGESLQGGVVKMPIQLQSSAMRGRFHKDGSMYVVGFRGWQTNAAAEAGFQRVRYLEDVGNDLPVEVDYTPTGIKLTFPHKLDAELAEDVSSYSGHRYNYVRGPQYGSGEFSVDNPDTVAEEAALKGESQKHRKRDTLEFESAKLSEDGKTVELVIAGHKPSQTLRVQYDLEDEEGEVIQNEFVGSVFEK